MVVAEGNKMVDMVKMKRKEQVRQKNLRTIWKK